MLLPKTVQVYSGIFFAIFFLHNKWGHSAAAAPVGWTAAPVWEAKGNSPTYILCVLPFINV